MSIYVIPLVFSSVVFGFLTCLCIFLILKRAYPEILALILLGLVVFGFLVVSNADYVVNDISLTKEMAGTFRQMARDVDNHRLFKSYDLVDQRFLLLTSKPVFDQHNPKLDKIESIIYNEFRAGSLNTARNWKGLYTMAADYLEMDSL